VAEDEVVVVRVERAARPGVELCDEAVGQRDRAAGREVGFAAVRELGAPPGLPNADALDRPVDVAPAQREQLALAQAGHGGGEDQDAQDRAQDVRGRGV